MTRFVQLLFTLLEMRIPNQEQGEDNLSYLFLFYFSKLHAMSPHLQQLDGKNDFLFSNSQP